MGWVQSDAEAHIRLGVRSLGHVAAAVATRIGAAVGCEPSCLLQLDVGDGVYPATTCLDVDSRSCRWRLLLRLLFRHRVQAFDGNGRSDHVIRPSG